MFKRNFFQYRNWSSSTDQQGKIAKYEIVCQLFVVVFQLNGQHFDDKDIEKMEAFAMFCGIGIHNTKTYESTCKLMAKQVERKREN